MTKQEFFDKMDSEEVFFPETEEQILWFEEWENLHPEQAEANDKVYREITENHATEYMALKIFARMFIEKNGTGKFTAIVEPRKITICGRGYKTDNKLEINL